MLQLLPWQPIHPLDGDIYYILAIILDKHLFCNTETSSFRQGNPIKNGSAELPWPKKNAQNRASGHF